MGPMNVKYVIFEYLIFENFIDEYLIFEYLISYIWSYLDHQAADDFFIFDFSPFLFYVLAFNQYDQLLIFPIHILDDRMQMVPVTIYMFVWFQLVHNCVLKGIQSSLSW